MKAKDYIRKRAELDVEYQEKQRALEIVWRMFNPDIPTPEVNPVTGRTSWRFPITKREATLEAMRTLDGIFQTKDVRVAVDQLNEEWGAALDDDELSSLVARIVVGSETEFELVESKAGRSPARYRKKIQENTE